MDGWVQLLDHTLKDIQKMEEFINLSEVPSYLVVIDIATHN